MIIHAGNAGVLDILLVTVALLDVVGNSAHVRAHVRAPSFVDIIAKVFLVVAVVQGEAKVRIGDIVSLGIIGNAMKKVVLVAKCVIFEMMIGIIID